MNDHNLAVDACVKLWARRWFVEGVCQIEKEVRKRERERGRGRTGQVMT